MTEAWHDFPSPGLITQVDGSPMQWSNCAPSTWANLVVSQQQGKRPAKGGPWYPSGASLRTQSGDRVGGIMPSTLDATVNRIYGIDLEVRIATVDAVQRHLDEGYAVGVLIQYAPFDGTAYSGSPGFRGAHSIPLFGSQHTSGRIQWLDGDPLYNGRRREIPKGPQWVDRTLVMRGGELLVLDSGGQTLRQRYGPGHLYAVFTTKPYLPPPQVVDGAPATAEERANQMLRGAWGVTSSKVQRLQPGQPLFSNPGGKRVTRVSGTRPASVSFIGKAGSSWGAVLVKTGSPYQDKQARPTVLYVPVAAGPISDR